MKNKRLTILLVCGAFAGFALAASIPVALARNANATYTQCTDPTYTEYCQNTTTTGTTPTTPTTSPSTSSVTTPLTPPPPATTPTGPGQPAPPPRHGTTLTANARVAVGTMLAKGVTVTANNHGRLTVNDHGTTFTVPAGATLLAAGDGVALVKTQTGGVAMLSIVVPAGGKARTLDVTLPRGVVFGYHSTPALILRDLGIYTGKPTTKQSKVAAKVQRLSPNNREAVILANRSLASVDLKLSYKRLVYMPAEQKFMAKHHIQNVVPRVKIHSNKFGNNIFTPKVKIRG